MYKITLKSGKTLGYTDNIRYIKKHRNGCFVQVSFDKAQGIAFKSTPYSLDEDGRLDGAVDTVTVEQMEDGDIVLDNTSDISDLRNAIEELYEMIGGV